MHHYPALSGDFYCRDEDVTRGLTLSLGDDAGCGNFDWRSKEWNCFQFQPTDMPPELSADLRSFLSATNWETSHGSCWTVGNNLLEFLTNTLEAELVKTSARKFSIKANVHIDGLTCLAKIRIYKDGPRCVVEFQRYGGDSLAFCELYKQAVQYLQYGCVTMDSHKWLSAPSMN